MTAISPLDLHVIHIILSKMRILILVSNLLNNDYLYCMAYVSLAWIQKQILPTLLVKHPRHPCFVLTRAVLPSALSNS